MLFRPDIAIDFGTSSVLIYIKGKGIVLQEPSVAAVSRVSDQVLAVGDEAKSLSDKYGQDVFEVRPFECGKIADYDLIRKMLKYFINKVSESTVFKPRVMVCLTAGVTEVERRAVIQACIQAGASKAYVIDAPVAAAIGIGIDDQQSFGNMILDIGGGITDISVMSLGDIVARKSVDAAGDTVDENIAQHIKDKYGVIVDCESAESLKVHIGGMVARTGIGAMEVRGRDLETGLSRKIELTREELANSISSCACEITEAVKDLLKIASPRLLSDITDRGISMIGGGSLIYGLDRYIEEKVGIKVKLLEDPATCVLNGMAKAMDDVKFF